jgi:hypothetical protein
VFDGAAAKPMSRLGEQIHKHNPMKRSFPSEATAARDLEPSGITGYPFVSRYNTAAQKVAGRLPYKDIPS